MGTCARAAGHNPGHNRSHAHRACPMRAPKTYKGSLQHTALTLKRPADVLPWNASNLSAYPQHMSRKLVFGPVGNFSSGEAYDVIRASQFRARCDRLLVLSDDRDHMGLGMMARVLMSALLWAVRIDRVLVEAPLANVSRARWCDRPPYTLQCFVQPWSHCRPPARPPLPVWNAQQAQPGGQFGDEPVVHVTMSMLTRGEIWMGVMSSAYGAAIRFLFRPRPWIHALGNCVMRSAGLRPLNFVSVHVRDSPEKREELWRFGKQRVPEMQEYLNPIRAMCPTHLHVQTANAEALAALEEFATGEGIRIAYTENARPGHDSWGGWNASQTMENGIVAFVNLAIGAQARLHEIAFGCDSQCRAPTRDHAVRTTARRRVYSSRPHSRCGRCWSRRSWSRKGLRCRYVGLHAGPRTMSADSPTLITHSSRASLLAGPALLPPRVRLAASHRAPVSERRRDRGVRDAHGRQMRDARSRPRAP